MIFLTLFKNDIKLFIKDWKSVVLLLILPFLFICLFIYTLAPYLDKSSFIEPFDIAIVDNEASIQSKMLVNQLSEIKIFNKVEKVDELKAKELLNQNKVASIITLPEGFTDSIFWGENRPVTVISNRNMPLQSYVAKNVILSAANLVSAGQSALNTINHYSKQTGMTGEEQYNKFNDSVMTFFMKTLARNEIFDQAEGSKRLNLSPAEYYTSALLVVFLMFAGMPAMKMFISERQNGITDRLKASPVKLRHAILSKLMISFLLSSAQFLIIIILTSIFFNSYWGAPIKDILLLFSAVILTISCWSVFVASISKTSANADAIGYLGILLMAVLGGSIYPLTSLPWFIKNISYLTPNRWAMDGFMTLFSGDRGLSITGSLVALMVISGVLLTLATALQKLARR